MEYFNIVTKEIKRGFYRHYFGFMNMKFPKKNY